MASMNEEWSKVPLARVTTPVREPVPVERGQEYTLLGVKMYGGGVTVRDLVTSDSSKASVLYRVRAGQFIYSKLWARAGAFGVIPPELDGNFVSTVFRTFECDETIVSAQFLWLYFQQPSVWAHIARDSTGSIATRTAWTDREYREFQMMLPPLPVQERIIEVIGAVDDQIAALKTEAAALAAVRHQTTGRFDDVAPVNIGSLAEVSQGKGLPKKSQGLRTGDVPWYKIADMAGSGNEYGYTSADTLMTEGEVIALGGSIIPADSIVFPRVGAAVLTEKKRIVETPGALDENHLILSPRDGISSEYLLAVMENFGLSSLVRPGAVPSLNMKLIRTASVPWSPSENDTLHHALGMMRGRLRAALAETDRLLCVRVSLIRALLNRDIEIKNAEEAIA